MELGGYAISDFLYEGKHINVYRGKRKADQKPVIIKIVKSEFPNALQIEDLNHEFEILNKLKSPRIVKAYGLEEIDNRLAIVLEDFDGQQLERALLEKKLDLKSALAIAIELAQGLGEIHHQHVIHKDVKPQNIIVDLDKKQIKYIDFSLSTQLSRENQQLYKPSSMAGTLAYISPEQTGRMNRSLDYRTDFYSLGVTLYQIFTRKLPFEALSPLELVYCHIAKYPIPPHELDPSIPKVLSDIIMKCLSKEAADRYHGAFGLKNDLELCLKELEETGTIADFEIGTNDIDEHFQIPAKLYGRENEIKELLKVFNHSAEGRAEVLLITGYSGIGKSSLVAEVHKSIIERNGHFIKGKFDQYKKNVPFHGLIKALDDLIDQTLLESDEELAQWKERILKAVGINGSILTDMLPKLKYVIGDLPKAPELSDPKASENRVNYVLTSFVEVFVNNLSPLVIFLDDLQWVDDYSIKFFENFISEFNRKYFLFIGAFRSNEVGINHPVTRSLAALKKANIVITEIGVKPLTLDAIENLVQDTLHMDAKETKSLAEVIIRKTQGNPFFLNQFLKTVYQKGLFNFDINEMRWKMALNNIEKIPVTDNVADFMSQKIRQLPETTQDLLKIGAAIGFNFDLETIARVNNSEPSQAAIDIFPALEDELIFKNINTSEQEISSISYTFQHDRVQQAAYQLISQDEKQQIHYRIGQVLLAGTTEENLDDAIIDIVNQLNEGIDLVTDPQERFKLAQFNKEAGEKAKVSAAFNSALTYFNTGISLLEEDSWKTHYDFTYSLYANAALCELSFGDKKRSEELYEIALRNAKTADEKGQLYTQKLTIYGELGEYQQALNMGVEALKLFNVDINLNPSQFTIISNVLLIKAKLKLFYSDLNKLKEIPNIKDERIKTIISIYGAMIYASVFSKGLLFPYLASQMTKLTLKYGISPYGTFGLSSFAAINCSEILKNQEEGFKLGLIAIDLAKRFPMTRPIADAYDVFYLFVSRWGLPISQIDEPLLKYAHVDMELGDFLYVATEYVFLTLYNFRAGRPLDELLKDLDVRFYEIFKTQKKDEILEILILRQMCLALKGKTPDPVDTYPTPPFPEWFSEEDFKDALTVISRNDLKVFLYTTKLYLLYFHGQFEKAFEVAQNVKPLGAHLVGHLIWDVFHFFYALTLVEVYLKTGDKARLKELQNYQAQFARWAKASPVNYLHQQLLLSAEMAKIEGKALEAIDLYEKAIEEARKNGFQNDEALCYELLARFYKKIGKEKLAFFYSKEASTAYAQWGASAKVDSLTQEFFHVAEITTPPTTAFASVSSPSELDVSTVVDVSKKLLEEIVLDKLIKAIMRIVTLSAGADKVFLVLDTHGKWMIQAMNTVPQEETVLENIPLEDMKDQLCYSAMQYVIRSRETLLLNNATAEGPFVNDPFILRNKPPSLAIVPLIHQKKLSGVLYLENSVVKGAFTEKRLGLLNVLTTLMAISIENAQFYAELERKVAERTVELKDKNVELEKAMINLKSVQDNLIQQEKLASLGLLTAGIAHELKNPLNFIVNFSQILHQMIDERIAEFGSTDEFLNILSQYTDKIDYHSKRADEIINNLLVHSRPGSIISESISILKIIDQSLEMSLAAAQKKHTDFSVSIKKVFNSKDTVLKVFPASLLRVFNNIIDNACYALAKKQKEVGSQFKPEIEIQLEDLPSNQLLIKFKDNGPGLTPENLRKIFNPFFTTKPPGEGTGLGMSLSFEIITRQHGGNMEAHSTLGESTELVITLPKEE